MIFVVEFIPQASLKRLFIVPLFKYEMHLDLFKRLDPYQLSAFWIFYSDIEAGNIKKRRRFASEN